MADRKLGVEEQVEQEREQKEKEVGPEQAPSVSACVFDQFDPPPPKLIMGPDGLPVEKDPPWSHRDALPPPLTPETLNCMKQPPDPKNGRFVELGRCIHYRRQRVNDIDCPDRPIINRMCCAPEMRGINGASMVIRDACVFDCELRIPPDPKAEFILDAIDAEKIDIGRERMDLAAGKDGGGRRHRGYRIFRTDKEAQEGKTMLAENEFTEISDD